ncbi:MAG TPA: hypothetical protein VNU27_00745 [Candidatus Acidoferrum sp.]|nr:hypothetical protein [Candidatus Acidoferrum sp.]
MGLQPDSNGRFGSIWSFVVIPAAGLLLFPVGYVLDVLLTPRARRAWVAWRVSRQVGGAR